jgi:6-phosphogluconolactonase
MSDRWLQVLPDADAAARRAAEVVAGRLRAAVSARGQFRLALSGGLTPIPMFEALAAMSLPWGQVEIYQVDERVAPLGSAQRNLTAIRAAFDRTGATIVAMPVESGDLAGAALRYEDGLPRDFDLVHLGLGLDGHTASLFPGDPALGVLDRYVALSGVSRGLPGMTLTYRGLAKAVEIIWLITGVAKAVPLARLCADDPDIPAVGVKCERMRFVTDAGAVDALKTNAPKGVHLWHRGT